MSRDAVVIGINTYQYLPTLSTPARDAEAIAQHLQTYGEFRVHRLPEVIQGRQAQVSSSARLTLRELETALIQLFKPKGGNVPHTALFYYSGHGIQKDAGIQEGFLAVSDSQPELGFYGLSLFWLRRLLQESPVRQRIIWLDCCHSGELLNFLEADPGARSGTDRLFMAASREFEAAYESLDTPYSVFTQALLDGLDPHQQASGMVTNHSLTAWVSQHLTGEIQQPLFENSGSEIILTRAQGASSGDKLPSTPDVCPYRGLEFFDEVHADYFFGRENLTDQLIEKLRTGQFVAVVGASGSGKSSLVRAGLIWELRQGRRFSGSDRWRIKLLTPTEHPLKSLAAVFIDPDLSELDRAEQLRRAEVFLKEGGSGLAQLVRASLPIESSTTGLQPSHRPRLLLVIDQFEELFTLCCGPYAERERRQFLECLMGALAAAKDSLKVVLVLRADFFSKCSLYENLVQYIEQHLVVVTPLSYEQIKATIVRPAQKVGLVCEPNLVYTMLLDVIGAPGELPLLQYTLLELWQRRQHNPDGKACLTLDTYTELGGVRGTLQKRATEIFYNLTVQEQAIAKRIFLALTQLGEGTEDTRRRVLKSELVSPAFPLESVEQTLEKLVAAKLVVTSREWSLEVKTQEELTDKSEGLVHSAHSASASSRLPNPFTLQSSYQETVDVAHEALIRNWSLLSNWLDENREMLQQQRRIERAAQEWDTAGKPTGADYLLQGGRLIDAEDFVTTYPHELSTLARQYVVMSQDESLRSRRESRLLQIAVPSVLVVALVMTFNQYINAMRAQTAKDDQLQIAMARERAVIAQSILQESDGDPMAALLISRLAAEQGGATFEAQASLRAALNQLQLQFELKGHQGGVRQVIFNVKQHYLATAGMDGTIRLWAFDRQAIYTAQPQLLQVLKAASSPTITGDASPEPLHSFAVSPNGEQIAAIAHRSTQVHLWSALSGQLIRHINLHQPAMQILFSPTGEWLATLGTDQILSLWRSDTGQLQTTLIHTGASGSVEFSADGQFLLTTPNRYTVQLWRLTPDAQQGVKLVLAATLPHSVPLAGTRLSPSGQWVVTVGADRQVRLWNAKTGKLEKIFTQPAVLTESITAPSTLSTALSSSEIASSYQILFSPNEQMLAIADAFQHVRLWRVKTGQLVTTLETTVSTDPLSKTVAFSPDSRLIATIDRYLVSQSNTNVIRLWDVQKGQAMGTIKGHEGAIDHIQFSPAGSHIVTTSRDGIVRLWATQPGGELPPIVSKTAPVEWMAFVKPAAGGLPIDPSGTIAAPDLQARPATVPDRTSPPQLVSTHSPSRSLAQQTIASLVTVDPRGIQQWQVWSDTHNNPTPTTEPSPYLNQTLPHQPIKPFPFGQWMITWMQRSLYCVNWGLTIERFVTQTFNPNSAKTPDSSSLSLEALLRAIAPVNTTLTGFALSSDGQTLATATADGWIELWQSQTNRSFQRLHRFLNAHFTDQNIAQNHANPLPLGSNSLRGATALQPTPASKTSDDTLNPIQQLVFSPNGQRLLGISDATVYVWDVQSGHVLRVLQGHQAQIQDAQFSPDGEQIITGSWDHTARIWQVTSGQLVRTVSYSARINGVSFSPSGQQVAIASQDGTAQLIDANTGTMQVVLTGHRDAILSAQFSPTGRSLVTTSTDGTARLWDTTTGEEQAQLRPNPDQAPSAVQHAFFSPDGQYVATLTQAGEVHLWLATWEGLLTLARDRTLRQLTPEECLHYLNLAPSHCPTVTIEP